MLRRILFAMHGTGSPLGAVFGRREVVSLTQREHPEAYSIALTALMVGPLESSAAELVGAFLLSVLWRDWHMNKDMVAYLNAARPFRGSLDVPDVV